MRRNHSSEYSEQSAVIAWADTAAIYDARLRWLMHYPSSGVRSPIAGARLKKAGMRRGIADLFLPAMAQGYGGLWIEMKSSRGRLSVEQASFLADMQKAGYKTAVCRSADHAIATICDYLSINQRSFPLTVLRQDSVCGMSC